MSHNGFFKSSKELNNKIKKAILTGIGATSSKEVIKKAAVGLYDDVQKITHNLLKELEEKGKLKTKETKKLILELQKKSEGEKVKIYKKLEKEGKGLFNTARELIITPIALASQVVKTVKKSKKKSKGKKKRK